MTWIAAGVGIIVFLIFQMAFWNLSERTQEAVNCRPEAAGGQPGSDNQSVSSPR